MTPRLAPVLAALVLILAAPMHASATHSECRWGAYGAVDPTDPDPVRYRIAAPAWGCRGPIVEATVGAGGQGISFRATGGGVTWWTTDPPGAGGDGRERPPAPSSEKRAGETIRLVVRPRRARAGRRVTFRARLLRRDASGVLPAGDYAIRMAGRSVRTGADGRARLTARLTRAGLVRIVALDGRRRVATAAVRVTPRR